jgi:hypothetical protein
MHNWQSMAGKYRLLFLVFSKPSAYVQMHKNSSCRRLNVGRILNLVAFAVRIFTLYFVAMYRPNKDKSASCPRACPADSNDMDGWHVPDQGLSSSL